MSEKTVLAYKKKLLKSRVGYGKSLESEAKRICKNETLRLIKECLEDPESTSQGKLQEIRDRVSGLKEDLCADISPFKPSNKLGFYVRKAQDKGKAVYVELRGLTNRGSVVSLVQYLLEVVYGLKVKQDPENKYKGVIFRKETVGDAFYVKGGGLVIRLKEYKQKIFVRFWNDGFTVKCSIVCPLSVKAKILPKLRKLEEDYWTAEVGCA